MTSRVIRLVQMGDETDIEGEVPFEDLVPEYCQYFLFETYFDGAEDTIESLLSVHRHLILSGSLTSIGLMEIGEVESVTEETIRWTPATFSGKDFDENAYDGVKINDTLDYEGQGDIDQVD